MHKAFRFNSVLLLSLLITMVLVIVSFFFFEQKVTLWVDSAIEGLLSFNSVFLLSIFLVVALACDMVLPIPSSVISVIATTTLGFWLGASVIWFGLMLSCCAGYFIGKRSSLFLLRGVAKRHDFLNMQALAEISVIAAGLVGYLLPSFLLLCSLSSAGLALTYAYSGAQAGVIDSFLWVTLGCAAVPSVMWLLNGCLGQAKNSLGTAC